jgi:hypothetical protein
MVALGRSRERHRLGVTDDDVHCASKPQSWTTTIIVFDEFLYEASVPAAIRDIHTQAKILWRVCVWVSHVRVLHACTSGVLMHC